MKVLIIGSGGREHALAWKLKQNPKVEEIFCSAGNGGISSIATLLPAGPEGDWEYYADCARKNKIALTVIGPEAPLAGGIADYFRQKNLPVFGPDKKCARLESSKIFAKEFMTKYGIPTAKYRVFESFSDASDFLNNLSLIGSSRNDALLSNLPLVIKADGLAAGKGVYICETKVEAETSLENMMVKKIYGTAGENVVIEEKLAGKELSLMAFCDGITLKALPPARDHKRVFDKDKGPNTGGMGAYAPAPLKEHVMQEIEETILQPFLRGIKREGLDYRGIIYFGIMLTYNGPYVLEFNVRFGDPETQVVLPLIKTDLKEILDAVVDQNLEKCRLELNGGCCVGVVLASGGYPGKYQTHKEISGLDSMTPGPDNVAVFHAGTVKESGKFYTSGGRVLNVVGLAATFAEARQKCYGAAANINFDEMHYRKDIAEM